MFSYYALSSSVMHHPEHKTLRAVYAFYYVSTATTVADLFQDALILANKVRRNDITDINLCRAKLAYKWRMFCVTCYITVNLFACAVGLLYINKLRKYSILKDKWKYKQTSRRTDRQTDVWMGKQMDRQSGRRMDG